MRRLRILVLVVLVACAGAPGPSQSPSPTTPPPPPIPTPGAAELRSEDCFPRSARTRGIPGFVPVPTTAEIQGPGDYAGPYTPLGTTGQRIAGRGFAYEVSSPVALVAGFYSACLEAYVTESDWKGPLRGEEGDELFRIPVQGGRQAVVLIADNPEGPTAVVIFTDYTVTEVPSPLPPPTPSETPSGTPSGTPSPGA